MKFIWDKVKNADNIKNHNISFEEAQTAFFDPNGRLISDPDHSVDEDRFIFLGLSKKLHLLVVCHCYKENDEIIRIISARKATKTEAKYYGG